MDEIDESWLQMLSKAMADAESGGRGDVADYLRLKLTNDQMRQAGIRWLFETVIEQAAQAGRAIAGISIEREHPHNFSAAGGNMVGSLVRVRHGVRSMTVEAGWPRTPSDGFIRGGALAAARILHFGIAGENTELYLRSGDIPRWHPDESSDSNTWFGADEIARHFEIFIGK
jgi:hypothetical protein